MNPLWEALTLHAGYNATLVAVGAALLGIAAGATGSFMVLRKRAHSSRQSPQGQDAKDQAPHCPPGMEAPAASLLPQVVVQMQTADHLASSTSLALMATASASPCAR